MPICFVHCFVPELLNLIRNTSISPIDAFPSSEPEVSPTNYTLPLLSKKTSLLDSFDEVPNCLVHCLLPDESNFIRNLET